MSDEQACKSEDQHRIDTLEELANAERELRNAKTRFEQAQWEVVKSAESLLEWRNQWGRLRQAALSCYPADVPVDSAFEDAQATMDRFCAEVNARNAALTPPQKEDGPLLDDQQSVTTESNSLDGGAKAEGPSISDLVASAGLPSDEQIAENFIASRSPNQPEEDGAGDEGGDDKHPERIKVGNAIPEGFTRWNCEDESGPDGVHEEALVEYISHLAVGGRRSARKMDLFWGLRNAEGVLDIIAYRIIEPATQFNELKADLNKQAETVAAEIEALNPVDNAGEEGRPDGFEPVDVMHFPDDPEDDAEWEPSSEASRTTAPGPVETVARTEQPKHMGELPDHGVGEATFPEGETRVMSAEEQRIMHVALRKSARVIDPQTNESQSLTREAEGIYAPNSSMWVNNMDPFADKPPEEVS